MAMPVVRFAIAAVMLWTGCPAGAEPAGADGPATEPSIAGTWSLVSYTREDPSTGAATFPFGQKPAGLLILLPSGRVAAVITAAGREPAPPGTEGIAEKQAKLFRTLTAYAGTWSSRGGVLAIHVDVAGLPEWVGTDQRREVRLEGDTLRIRTQPMQSVSDGKTYVYVLTWRRLPDAAP